MEAPLTSFNNPYTTSLGNNQETFNLQNFNTILTLLCRRPCLFIHISAPFRAVQLRPDLSCLWKLLGDACTAVRVVSPSRAQVVVPTLLSGFDSSTQDHMLNQAQTLKAGERYYKVLSIHYATLKQVYFD